MDIHETKVGTVVVLMPEGNLTSGPDCQVLDRKLKVLLDGKERQFVVDGTKVGQIGSGAMRALLLAGHKLTQQGGRLVLCALSERVRQAFKISGFDNDFTIVSTQDRAVALAQEAPQAQAPGTETGAPRRDEHRERLKALLARTLTIGVKKVARPAGAGVRLASFERTRDLALSLLEGESTSTEVP